VVIVEPDQLLVFERVYAHRQSTGEWPRLELLQRQLASEHIDVSVRGLVMRSAEYAGIVSPDEQVRLTLRGLGAVPAAQPLLEAYRRLLHSIIERYRDPRLDEARYGSEDFDKLDLEPTLKRELSDLLRDDAWALGSGGGNGDSWSYAISDQLERPRRHALDLSADFRVPRIVLRLLRKLDEAQVAQAVAVALPSSIGSTTSLFQHAALSGRPS
jgi:hypothetical protein